jgi:hypothetical protein
MLKLNLGEDDSVSYPYDPRKDPATVGQILETRYGLYTGFFEICGPEIAKYMEEAMSKRLDSLLSREDVSRAVLEEVGTKIERRFVEFLDSYEAERILATSGPYAVPSKAALEGTITGIREKGNRRPTFVDTGTLRDSFRAWLVDQ